ILPHYPNSICSLLRHPSTADLYTLSLHDALPISLLARQTACDGPRLVRLARVADRRVERLQRALEEASETAAIQTGGFELGNERSEEHTSELQSLAYLVCRLLLEKKKRKHIILLS